MNEEIAEYYEELYRLYIDENQPLERRYRQLRESLERVVRERIQGNSLQTTDLAARINYVATQYELDIKEQNQLHTFRLTSNDILNHRKFPAKEEFLRDLRAVAFAYRKMFAQDIPLKLFSVLPKQEITSLGKKEKKEYIRRIRVCFDYAVFFFKKSDNPFLFRFYFCFPSICVAINLYIFSCLYLVVTSPLC